jgi:hypothetical protein
VAVQEALAPNWVTVKQCKQLEAWRSTKAGGLTADRLRKEDLVYPLADQDYYREMHESAHSSLKQYIKGG